MSSADYLKQLGRDGSYIEVDVQDLMTTDLSQAKMVVLKCARLEMSAPKQVEQLKRVLEALKATDELRNMTNAQMGFFGFRMIFDTGLGWHASLPQQRVSSATTPASPASPATPVGK